MSTRGAQQDGDANRTVETEVTAEVAEDVGAFPGFPLQLCSLSTFSVGGSLGGLEAEGAVNCGKSTEGPGLSGPEVPEPWEPGLTLLPSLISLQPQPEASRTPENLPSPSAQLSLGPSFVQSHFQAQYR